MVHGAGQLPSVVGLLGLYSQANVMVETKSMRHPSETKSMWHPSEIKSMSSCSIHSHILSLCLSVLVFEYSILS